MIANLLAMSDQTTGLVAFFIGMGVVFLGISVLIFAVWIMGKLMKVKSSEKKQEINLAPTEHVPAPVLVEDESIPEHIKVAIMAAIYAYYSEKKEKCEFTVKKIKRRS